MLKRKKMLPLVQKQLVNAILEEYKPELLYLSGSRLYGTNKEDSDYDYRGVVFPKITHILGLGAVLNRFEQFDLTKTHNCVLFNIQKAFKLWIENNPNAIEALYIPKQFIIYQSGIYKEVREHRHLFLSQKAFHTFRGYAHAQKNRLDKLNEDINQNKKRLDDFYNLGYDSKQAMHCLRLQRQCLEILNKHHFNVNREEIDAEFLKEVRVGKFTKTEILEMIDKLDLELVEAQKVTTLQYQANIKEIDKLLQRILFVFIQDNYA